MTLNVTINVDRDGLTRIRGKMSRIITNLPREFGEEIHDNMKNIRDRMAEIIKNKRTGRNESTLADSFQIVNTENTNKNITWAIKVVGPAKRYADYVDEGFTPHWVKISDKPNLREWIQATLPHSVAEKMIASDRILVGRATPWNPSGMRFNEIALSENINITREQLRERIQKQLAR